MIYARCFKLHRINLVKKNLISHFFIIILNLKLTNYFFMGDGTKVVAYSTRREREAMRERQRRDAEQARREEEQERREQERRREHARRLEQERRERAGRGNARGA